MLPRHVSFESVTAPLATPFCAKCPILNRHASTPDSAASAMAALTPRSLFWRVAVVLMVLLCAPRCDCRATMRRGGGGRGATGRGRGGSVGSGRRVSRGAWSARANGGGTRTGALSGGGVRRAGGFRPRPGGPYPGQGYRSVGVNPDGLPVTSSFRPRGKAPVSSSFSFNRAGPTTSPVRDQGAQVGQAIARATPRPAAARNPRRPRVGPVSEPPRRDREVADSIPPGAVQRRVQRPPQLTPSTALRKVQRPDDTTALSRPRATPVTASHRAALVDLQEQPAATATPRMSANEAFRKAIASAPRIDVSRGPDWDRATGGVAREATEERVGGERAGSIVGDRPIAPDPTPFPPALEVREPMPTDPVVSSERVVKVRPTTDPAPTTTPPVDTSTAVPRQMASSDSTEVKNRPTANPATEDAAAAEVSVPEPAEISLEAATNEVKVNTRPRPSDWNPPDGADDGVPAQSAGAFGDAVGATSTDGQSTTTPGEHSIAPHHIEEVLHHQQGPHPQTQPQPQETQLQVPEGTQAQTPMQTPVQTPSLSTDTAEGAVPMANREDTGVDSGSRSPSFSGNTAVLDKESTPTPVTGDTSGDGLVSTPVDIPGGVDSSNTDTVASGTSRQPRDSSARGGSDAVGNGDGGSKGSGLESSGGGHKKGSWTMPNPMAPVFGGRKDSGRAYAPRGFRGGEVKREPDACAVLKARPSEIRRGQQTEEQRRWMVRFRENVTADEFHKLSRIMATYRPSRGFTEGKVNNETATGGAIDKAHEKDMVAEERATEENEAKDNANDDLHPVLRPSAPMFRVATLQGLTRRDMFNFQHRYAGDIEFIEQDLEVMAFQESHPLPVTVRPPVRSRRGGPSDVATVKSGVVAGIETCNFTQSSLSHSQWNLDRATASTERVEAYRPGTRGGGGLTVLDGMYEPPECLCGRGVTIFVMDTGVRTTHEDFKPAGRVRPGWDFVACHGRINDESGHGTHTAGTALGVTSGVAKCATLVPVKILDGEGKGSSSTMLSALDWVLDHGVGDDRKVVSMSVGGPRSEVINAAVRELVAAGVPVIVAAGNEGEDAAGVSPASELQAITVGSTSCPGDNRGWGLGTR